MDRRPNWLVPVSIILTGAAGFLTLLAGWFMGYSTP